MNFGHNLALQSVQLFTLHEQKVLETIGEKNEEILKLTDQMNDLTSFLGLVETKLKNEDTVTARFINPDEHEVIDRIREALMENPEGLEGALRLFAHGKYSWEVTELNSLKEMLGRYVEGPLQRKISMGSEEMVLNHHELTKVLDIFRSGLTRMNDQIQRILSNILRSR
ncbi:MAG: hypothetical protein KR126chlam1_00390 [Chlamydiae bacterium]|nr:hypothetical protein [Chlamydiota bacterium]